MKKLLLFLIVFCLAGSISGLNEKKEPKTETGTLMVLVKGFKSMEGQLMVALFNKSEDFPDKKPYKGDIMAISANEELIKFENLPFGDYAVAAIHDINLDGKLDKNALGIPTEGYGFSNNAMDKYGPPSFLQASFVFFDNNEAKIIELEYGIPKSK